MKGMLINGIILPFISACLLLYFSITKPDTHIGITILSGMNFAVSLYNLIILIVSSDTISIDVMSNKRSWDTPDKPITPTPDE